MYPAVSADGLRLVFSSYRPAPGESSEHPSAYLWCAEREGDGWSTPVFQTAVNQFGHYHSQPIFNKKGELFFIRSSWDYSDHREFVCHWVGDQLAAPVANQAWSYWKQQVPENCSLWETIPGYDDSYVVLVISQRGEAGDLSAADLWIAFRDGDRWTDAKPLESGIKSEKTENFGFYSHDGRQFFFVRDFSQFYRVPIGALLRHR